LLSKSTCAATAWRALEYLAERNAARIADDWCQRALIPPPPPQPPLPPLAPPPHLPPPSPPPPPPTRGFIFKEETKVGREWRGCTS
jgi:hypothetical protein